MTAEDVSSFEKIQVQVESLYIELSALAKKAPNNSLNVFKLKFVNKAINEANLLLGRAYLPFEDFDQFEVDDVPTNSDVAMILGQYLACLEKYRADNVVRLSNGMWCWKTTDPVNIRTSPPQKINIKK